MAQATHKNTKTAQERPMQPKKTHAESGAMKKFSLAEKQYGANTYVSIDPTPQPPQKRLAQSTLQETMKRYRAMKRTEGADGQASEEKENKNQQFFRDVDETIGDKPVDDTMYDKARRFFFSAHNEGDGGTAWMPHPTPLPSPSTLLKNKQRAQRILNSLPMNENEKTSNHACVTVERWSWLAHRRDAQGRSPDHPRFDPRTLLIPPSEFSKLRGFNAQYWEIKSNYMDVVLFVRVGSFYELYDCDADIGLQVGLNPMGAHGEGAHSVNMWKVGCSASSFGQWAGRVLALGHSVGRVEECRRAGDGSNMQSRTTTTTTPKSSLVKRRLVQLYTPGTALNLLCTHNGEGEGEGVQQGCGPCVCLFEGSNGLMGACVVDVPSASISLSQWQEVDTGRSMLKALLMHVNPAEVVLLALKTVGVEVHQHEENKDGGPCDVENTTEGEQPSPHSHAGKEEGEGVEGGEVVVMVTKETKKCIKQHKPLVADGIELRSLPITILRNSSTLCGVGDGILNPEHDVTAIPELLSCCEHMYFSLHGRRTAYEAAADDIIQMPHAVTAFMMAMMHLSATNTASHVLPHLTSLAISQTSCFAADAHETGRMMLDSTALCSLEILEGSCGGVKGSLLSFLQQGAVTAAGCRQIKEWLCAPLFRVGEIQERLDTVSAFMGLPNAVEEFQNEVLQCHHEAAGGGGGGGGWRMKDVHRLLPKVATLLQSIQTDANNDEDAEVEEIETSPYSSGTLSAQKTYNGNSVFVSAIQLFQGLESYLSAVAALQQAIDEHRPGGCATLPLVSRAITLAASITEPLATLSGIFQVLRDDEDDAGNDALFPPVVPPHTYNTALVELHKARRRVKEVEERHRQEILSLAANGTTSTTLLTVRQSVADKIKIVHTGGVPSLEVPIRFKPYITTASSAPPGLPRIVKETKSVIRLELSPQMKHAMQRLYEATSSMERALVAHMSAATDVFLSHYSSFVAFASSVAVLDALASFSIVTRPSATFAFCRPVFIATPDNNYLNFRGLWNPQLVLSSPPATTSSGSGSGDGVITIQANDVVLGGDGKEDATSPTMMILTGANAGGKSTLLRSTCIASILAHIGCYVP